MKKNTNRSPGFLHLNKMNINIELFKRYKPEKKVQIIMALTEDELLSITPATVTRIIKEGGTRLYRYRDKRLWIPDGFRTGNHWNSTFNAVELIKGKLFVSLYVQYSNTDTDTDATYNEFFSSGDYRGAIQYEDRYGNPHTDYYTYTPSDKARALRSLLLTYVQRKYNTNHGKD